MPPGQDAPEAATDGGSLFSLADSHNSTRRDIGGAVVASYGEWSWPREAGPDDVPF